MIRAAAVIALMLVNLVHHGTLVFLGGMVKLLTFGAPRHRIIARLGLIGERWAVRNNRIFDRFLDTRWEIEVPEGTRRDGHYLAIANHISWLDIFVVLRAFEGRAPFLRFFLKRNLAWLPIVGAAAWILGFPFMRRYSPEYLAAHPEKRGLDLETTRKACRRYRHIPVTILNFAEGTRFTPEKHAEQRSPYRHLLRPRIGGIGFVLASLAEQLDAMYDVTIVYPSRDITIWRFVTNRVPVIRVYVREIAIPREILASGDVTEAGAAREALKVWADAVWREKDALIERVGQGRVADAHRSKIPNYEDFR